MLEIVLGIDNIVFISVLTGRLPEKQRRRGPFHRPAAGDGDANRPAAVAVLDDGHDGRFDYGIRRGHFGRDLILLAGGVFLIFKATREIHNSLEIDEVAEHRTGAASLVGVLVQIALIDVVFSLDSVITAVGLVDDLPVMIAAIVAAVVVMMVAAGPVSDFIDGNPTIKMLALTFLVLIGFALVTEGLDIHVPKGYIYFAMAFSFGVQMLNIGASKRGKVKLRKARLGDLILMNERE